MQILTGRRRDTLTRSEMQDFLEKRKEITKKRINRVAIGVDKRLRSMHAAEIADGSRTMNLMTFGACIRPCAIRSIANCEHCHRFSKFKPGTPAQVDRAWARYNRQNANRKGA